MGRPGTVVLLCGLAFSWTAGPASAQQGRVVTDPAEQMLEDVSGIHDTLVRLVDLLESLHTHQKIDLLIKRIELKERRLAPLARRLRSAESQVENLETETARTNMWRDQVQEELDVNVVRGGQVPDGAREQLAQAERELERLDVELEAERFRVRRLEDELAEGREDIEDLDAMLLELLE